MLTSPEILRLALLKSEARRSPQQGCDLCDRDALPSFCYLQCVGNLKRPYRRDEHFVSCTRLVFIIGQAGRFGCGNWAAIFDRLQNI